MENETIFNYSLIYLQGDWLKSRKSLGSVKGVYNSIWVLFTGLRESKINVYIIMFLNNYFLIWTPCK
jgi:hypothetical protein